ncbi:uncharacterized protein TRIADDRAFT_55967 [Trichoplax adhaerens]|uniref:Uncharacterized protein n=1 Tax=Trichoplax adhaerens TaxID=10228 RepID=B3RTL4_TRIAD|nr:hypothetical protein TRIADDRAFT_55967 [Trichoplax adhaerens]EDV25653.1 hypothetical protein TRIADDRAFT_55967 [Trichoplax adhaerens]|eukprot:XP_002111686.1 hypothetical protein TRIADDRAFT_55967 [Trichoplax adhaerens]
MTFKLFFGRIAMAWVNPIAAARSSAAPPSGPTIRDYLNRPRPTWDEVKEKLGKSKEGSHSLADWEKQQEENYKEDLRRHREEVLGKSKKSKKKKVSSSSQDSDSDPDSCDSFGRDKKFICHLFIFMYMFINYFKEKEKEKEEKD